MKKRKEKLPYPGDEFFHATHQRAGIIDNPYCLICHPTLPLFPATEDK